MRHTFAFALVFMALLFIACSSEKKANQFLKNQIMNGKTIMEVTTFNIKSTVDPTDFKKRDQQVENDFTSKQPGFIKRQSGINEKGEYAVIVYWEKVTDAEASMNKFMSDASVADYAQMIDGPTMKMSRYNMDKTFQADESEFVEVMTFDLTEGTHPAKFQKLNYKVEADYTGTRVAADLTLKQSE